MTYQCVEANGFTLIFFTKLWKVGFGRTLRKLEDMVSYLRPTLGLRPLRVFKYFDFKRIADAILKYRKHLFFRSFMKLLIEKNFHKYTRIFMSLNKNNWTDMLEFWRFCCFTNIYITHIHMYTMLNYFYFKVSFRYFKEREVKLRLFRCDFCRLLIAELCLIAKI